MSKFTCKICGKEFERRGHAIYCDGPHYRPCPICGEPVAYVRPSDPVRCCSKACSATMKRTSISKSQELRVCLECGRTFQPRSWSQKWCDYPHIKLCVICGKPITYYGESKKVGDTCSWACRMQLRSQRLMEATGYDNVSKTPEMRDRLRTLTLDPDISAKRIATNQARFGVDNPATAPEIRKKIQAAVSSEDYLATRAQTCLAKYGATTPMRNPDVVTKRNARSYKLFFAPDAPQRKSWYTRQMTDATKVDAYLSFHDDPEAYLSAHHPDGVSMLDLTFELGVNDTTIRPILTASSCEHYIQVPHSNFEASVIQFLQSIDPDIQIVCNARNVITPYELDIFLPDYKLAIECNPAATHNSSIPDPWGAPPKSKTYHQMKSLLCKEQGVFLFHIFLYEWIAKRSIIESMLRNLLHKNTLCIGARATYVTNVPFNECCEFLNANHRQGQVSASIRLGLRDIHTHQLLSVMTFNKPKLTMGRTGTESLHTWELSRFCNKLSTTVSGGASKLLNHFEQCYHPELVYSFSDIAHTQGKLYPKLGFRFVHATDPSYIWVNDRDTVYHHRVACQKQFLQKLLNDPHLDLSQSEVDIMIAHHYVQVFDCGVIRWEKQYIKPEDYRG